MNFKQKTILWKIFSIVLTLIIELLLSHEEILKAQISSKDDSEMETNFGVNALGTL